MKTRTAWVVWKYQFDIDDGEQTKDIPLMHQCLYVAMQAGKLCLWVLVNPSNATVSKGFVLHGTGHPIGDDEDYVGSSLDGQFVWHLFKRKS